MRIIDLLFRKPQVVDRDISFLERHHIPEFGVRPSKPKNKRTLAWPRYSSRLRKLHDARHFPRVTVRWIKKHDYDNRRVWYLGIVCYDNVPCMVTQNGGREGDDEYYSWVFNKSVYLNMVRYLTNRNTIRTPRIYKVEWNIPELGNFYANKLEDPQEEWVVFYLK